MLSFCCLPCRVWVSGGQGGYDLFPATSQHVCGRGRGAGNSGMVLLMRKIQNTLSPSYDFGTSSSVISLSFHTGLPVPPQTAQGLPLPGLVPVPAAPLFPQLSQVVAHISASCWGLPWPFYVKLQPSLRNGVSPLLFSIGVTNYMHKHKATLYWFSLSSPL